jgi:phenylalanyl-tRNA synthetase beta subunit
MTMSLRSSSSFVGVQKQKKKTMNTSSSLSSGINEQSIRRQWQVKGLLSYFADIEKKKKTKRQRTFDLSSSFVTNGENIRRWQQVEGSSSSIASNEKKGKDDDELGVHHRLL